jgi:hypothetical protein
MTHISVVVLLGSLAIASAHLSAACTQPNAAGSNLTMYPCAGADPARFAWDYIPGKAPWGPRLFQLRGSSPPVCMAVVGTSPLSSSPNVASAPCDTTSPTAYTQGWYIQADSSIISSQDGNVLDVYDNQVTPGTRVDTFGPNGGSNQLWSYNATTGQLVTALDSFCAGLC